MIGPSTGIWPGAGMAVAASGGANVTTSFGEMTLSGANGVAVSGTSIASGDASGHWQIISGRICPSAAGDTANLNLGPYSLVLNNDQTVDISIVANQGDARTGAELVALCVALAAIDSTADYVANVRDGSVLTDIGSDFITINGVVMDGLISDPNQGVDTSAGNGSYDFDAVASLVGGSITITTDGTAYVDDCLYIVACSGIRVTGLTFRREVTGVGSTDWKLLVDTFDPDPVIGDFIFADNIFTQNTDVLATWTSGINIRNANETVIEDNTFNRVFYGFKTYSVARSVMRRNEVSEFLVDASGASSSILPAARVEYTGNTVYAWTPDVAGTPIVGALHPDCFQLGVEGEAGGWGMFIARNCFYPYATRPDYASDTGLSVQALFMARNDFPHAEAMTGTIINNFFACSSWNALSANWPNGRLLIANNTIIEVTNDPVQASFTGDPRIIMSSVQSDDQDATLIDNLTSAIIGSNNTETGNVIIDSALQSGPAAYSTLFDGPFTWDATLGAAQYHAAMTPLTAAGIRAAADTVFLPAAGGAAVGKGHTVEYVPTGQTTDPNITAIDTNGWKASYTSPPTFDPVGDPKYVVVERSGFDASGGAITVTDDLLIMSRVRQPYPDHASLTASDVALQDYIYAGDTVAGVTNNSTRGYPKPLAMWLDHDLRRVSGQSYTAKLAVAHGHARSGRPVAAVKFSATDGTITVEQTVSTMTKTDYAVSGLSVPHFEATLDLSTLDDDALITIDAVIYPWVGTSAQASVDFDTYPSMNFCEMKVFNAVTSAEDTIFAYVDGTGGGTPQVSTTEATALANPYATVAAAAAAIATSDGADASRGLIKITANTTIAHVSFTTTVGPTPLIVQGVAKATSVYQDAGAHSFNGIPDKLKLLDLTLQRSDSGNRVFLDSAADATNSSNMLVTENCTWDANGFSPAYASAVYRVGLYWQIECDGDDLGLGIATALRKLINSIGCGDYGIGHNTFNAAGCNDQADANFKDLSINVNRPAPVGRFLGWNFLGNTSNGVKIVNIDVTIDARGIAIVGNVIEQSGGATNSALSFLESTNTTTSENVVRMCNTIVGARSNSQYNSAGTVARAHSGFNKFDVSRQHNSKSDVFGTNGNLIGNWPVIYKVGHMANAMLIGSSSDDSVGVGSWMGEIASIGEASGTDATPLVADWADDASTDGTGLGGGDYSPGASSALPLIASGLAPYPYDLNGVPVADDGTAYVGAAQ